MQNDFMDNFEKLNRRAVESAKRLGEIQLRTLERVTERQMAAAADCLDGGMRQLALLGESRDVETALKEQTRLATDFNRKLVEHARMAAELMAETRDELAQWMHDGIRAASDAGTQAGGEKTA